MSQTRRTWEDNAAEFAALDRGEGWQFAVLVACSVDRVSHGGDRRSSGDHRLKVSCVEFARIATGSGGGEKRIARYFDAWQDAAAKGWVQDATSLTPDHAHTLAIPDRPWRAKDGGVYDASKTGGQINNTEQIADKAANDPAYAKRVMGAVSSANTGAASEAIAAALTDPAVAEAVMADSDTRRAVTEATVRNVERDVAEVEKKRAANPADRRVREGLDKSRAELMFAEVGLSMRQLIEVLATVNITSDFAEKVALDVEWIDQRWEWIKTAIENRSASMDAELTALLSQER